MRAAVLTAPGRFEIQQVALPVPQAHQLRVRLQGCGVCASNLPAFEGRDWFDYPLPAGDLGHEGWGVVDAVGQQVRAVAVGQPVAALSFAAYADYDLADEDAVVALPPELAGADFPGEALGCVMNIWRRAKVRAGHDVAIVGCGFLGVALTELAAQAGARVIAVSRSAASLAQAQAAGASAAITLDADNPVAAVEDLTAGRGCERVIEATGKGPPLDLAGALTAFGGRLIVAGFHQDGPRQIDMQLWNWRGIDVINAHERDPAVAVAGIREAVAASLEGRLSPRQLVTHRYSLGNIGEALAAVQERRAGLIKAVVRMDAGAA